MVRRAAVLDPDTPASGVMTLRFSDPNSEGASISPVAAQEGRVVKLLGAILAVLIAGCGASAPSVTPPPTLAPTATPTASPSPTPSPVPTRTPVATPAPPGLIRFGVKLGRTNCDLTPMQSMFNVGGVLAWYAAFAEPAGSTTLQEILVRTTAGSESVALGRNTQLASPTWLGLCNDDPKVTTSLGAGTYVLRYVRDSTVLAEGSFAIIK